MSKDAHDFSVWFCRINSFMNLFRQNADILKILKFKLLATYVFLILQYLAEISRFWINATEPNEPNKARTRGRLLIFFAVIRL